MIIGFYLTGQKSTPLRQKFGIAENRRIFVRKWYFLILKSHNQDNDHKFFNNTVGQIRVNTDNNAAGKYRGGGIFSK